MKNILTESETEALLGPVLTPAPVPRSIESALTLALCMQDRPVEIIPKQMMYIKRVLNARLADALIESRCAHAEHLLLKFHESLLKETI